MIEAKEELTERMFTEMLNWAKTAETFVGAQAPLYVEELLTYAFWVHLAQTGLWFFILALAIYTFCYGLKLEFGKAAKANIEAMKDDYNIYALTAAESNRVLKASLCTAIGGIVTIFSLVAFTVYIKFLAKVILAPRVYLVEHLQNML